MDELAKIASNVSIPLEQGSVFRLSNREEKVARLVVSIPLEQGSVFRQIASQLDEGESLSQSLWNRAVSSDEAKQAIKYRLSLNPFGTGQCLPTAVVFWSLVAQGLREPLPNFFRDLESWVLIWLNIVQFLTFYSLIKRSKTEGILPEFLDFTSLNSLKIPNKS